MKKMLTIAAASLLLCAGGATLWANVSSDEFIDENDKALNESRGVNPVICYYESRSCKGASYWDCGNCIRFECSKGVNETGLCVPTNG